MTVRVARASFSASSATSWTSALQIERRGGRLLPTWALAEDDVDDERFWNEGDGPGWAAQQAPVEFATIDADLLGSAATAGDRRGRGGCGMRV